MKYPTTCHVPSFSRIAVTVSTAAAFRSKVVSNSNTTYHRSRKDTRGDDGKQQRPNIPDKPNPAWHGIGGTHESERCRTPLISATPV